MKRDIVDEINAEIDSWPVEVTERLERELKDKTYGGTMTKPANPLPDDTIARVAKTLRTDTDDITGATKDQILARLKSRRDLAVSICNQIERMISEVQGAG